MGRKKVKVKNFSKEKKRFLRQAPIIQPTSDLSDLKHDLENQLSKMEQKLERLRKKLSYVSSRTPVDHYKAVCEEYPQDAANAMIFIEKLVHHMFCEIACFTILEGNEEKTQIYKIRHKYVIHKIIMRVLRIHSEELYGKNIHFNIHPSDVVWEINEVIFSAIVLKIVENCTKYCKQGSELNIFIEDNGIKFQMNSLKIETSEKNKIFDEDYSWKNSYKLPVSSSWKWLFHAKKLAEFLCLEIGVNPGLVVEEIDGTPYAQNEFYIKNIV